MALQNVRVTLEEDPCSSSSYTDSSEDQEDADVNGLSASSKSFKINGLSFSPFPFDFFIVAELLSLVPDALMCVLESHLELMGSFERRTLG